MRWALLLRRDECCAQMSFLRRHSCRQSRQAAWRRSSFCCTIVLITARGMREAARAFTMQRCWTTLGVPKSCWSTAHQQMLLTTWVRRPCRSRRRRPAPMYLKPSYEARASVWVSRRALAPGAIPRITPTPLGALRRPWPKDLRRPICPATTVFDPTRLLH